MVLIASGGDKCGRVLIAGGNNVLAFIAVYKYCVGKYWDI